MMSREINTRGAHSRRVMFIATSTPPVRVDDLHRACHSASPATIAHNGMVPIAGERFELCGSGMVFHYVCLSVVTDEIGDLFAGAPSSYAFFYPLIPPAKPVTTVTSLILRIQ
jgi:hypothetical protein